MTNSQPLSHQQLAAIADVFLNHNAAHGALHEAASIFLSGLEAINSVEIFRFNPEKPVLLAGGKAIDPMTAAVCIADYYRTTQFIRALYAAILKLKSNNLHRPIHVFYVGTGPYAALMLPILARFSPDEVQFTLVECHPTTLQLLQKTLDYFQLDPYIIRVIGEDALQLQLKNYPPVDIFITETMQAALKQEPQVAITLHLAPQLSENAIFIPEKIEVWAGLSNLANFSRQLDDPTFNYLKTVQRLGHLMTLTRYSNASFPVIPIPVSLAMVETYPILSLYTEIGIFEDIGLKSGDSVLNLPWKLLDFRKIENPVTDLYFQYKISQAPGFRYAFHQNEL